ncbi:MAG: class II fumarate hydratase [Alphaproteobacteria bacterium]|nr:class II fumarate hydratase [Alphaproteobacteria bacterium]
MKRTETDSLGAVEIDAARYWGPQTERARSLFRIGTERLPTGLIRAIGLQKQAAAEANLALGELSRTVAAPIVTAAREVAEGKLDNEFPLPVWQTGSGTQTNMNANEVIANRANEMQGQPLGNRSPVHPNDHVNRGQSSNDSFPTVMHIAAAEAIQFLTIPCLRILADALNRRAAQWDGIIKIGRTHMMDAVPTTLGQECATWACQIETGIERLEAVMPRLLLVPQGGTAVGTGLNRHPQFDVAFCERLAALCGLDFAPHPRKAEGISAHDVFVELSGALNTVAVSLNKIANDIRLLCSGPRAGIAELIVPEDGLSSSIMPGKSNPTQCEAMAMVCAQVMGNNVAITFGAAQGHLELNTFKPLIIHNILQGTRLIADAAESFAVNMIDRMEPNLAQIAEHLARSPMLVTALAPHIGYDNAVRIAKRAMEDNSTLREAADKLALVTPEDFDRWVRPERMIGPSVTEA